MRKSLAGLLLLLVCPILLAQQTLDNAAVVKLIKAGLSDSLIVTTINDSPGKYDITADGLIALKKAGASDAIIGAILHRASSESASTPTAASESSGTVGGSISQPSSPPSENGNTNSNTSSESDRIEPGARVVIAPMGGFETYFAAAVRKKKVPIALTLDKTSAEYFVVSTNTAWRGFVFGSGGGATWDAAGGSAAYGSAASSTRGLEASIMLISAKTKDVVWAYEVHKSSHGSLLFGTLGARGQQSLAEACAKHLKEFIEKGR